MSHGIALLLLQLRMTVFHFVVKQMVLLFPAAPESPCQVVLTGSAHVTI